MGGVKACHLERPKHKTIVAMTQDRVHQYPYQRLPTAASIRLIRVLPDRIDNSIVCSLQTINSAHHTGVGYQALSYLWGDPKPTRKIYVRNQNDGVLHEHHLHENLWQFLDKWQQPRTQPSGLLWTDLLCLNQEDSEEMAQQIPRMGEIYSGAKEVIIWLGPDTISMEWTRDRWGEEGRNAATRILELPYWRRVWIVQEIALAQRALVTCGDFSMEINEFWMTLPAPMKFELIGHLYVLKNDKSATFDFILSGLLVLGKAESTKAVDKVFGFLGLVNDPREDGSPLTDHIRVDYARRPVDVLFDAVFEAYPRFGHTQFLLQELETSFGRAEDGHGIRADAQALAGYLRERGISERHVQLASVALHVYEAARVAVSQLALSSIIWREITKRIGLDFLQRSYKGPEWPSSPARHAAFVGFNLTMDRDPLCEDRQTLGLQGQASPWLCSAHGEVKEPGPVLNTLGAVTTFAFDTRRLARLCARHSLESGCDVSRVDFDMPDIGFRMSMSPADAKSGTFEVTIAGPSGQE